MATNPKSKPATVKSVTSAAASSVKNVASLAAQKNKVAPANQAAFNKGIQDLMKEEGQLAGMLGGLATAVGGGGSTSGGSTDQYYTSTGHSGTSSTGQHYLNGQPVTAKEFNDYIGSSNKNVGSGFSATSYDLGSSTKTVATVLQNQDGSTTTYFTDGTTSSTAAPDVMSTTAGKNALQLMQSTLQGYGIDDASGKISNAITGLLQSNYDSATITALIQDPNASKSQDPNVVALAGAWNARFSGNVAREKAGLPPLDPATYIATENSYKAVMGLAGIPASSPLMDPSYFGNLMAKDLSPVEVQQRVDAATTAVNTTDAFTKQQLQQQFGLTQSDMVSHLLDPQTASNVIQQKVQASQIAGEAGRQNLALNQQNAMSLAAQGITQGQASAGFTNVGSQLAQQQQLASMYGMNASNVGNELTAQQFNANINGVSAAQAQQDLTRLRAQEVNQFSGSSGAAKGSLYTEQSGVS